MPDLTEEEYDVLDELWGCENAFFKVVAELRSESILCLHYGQTRIIKKLEVIEQNIELKVCDGSW